MLTSLGEHIRELDLHLNLTITELVFEVQIEAEAHQLQHAFARDHRIQFVEAVSGAAGLQRQRPTRRCRVEVKRLP